MLHCVRSHHEMLPKYEVPATYLKLVTDMCALSTCLWTVRRCLFLRHPIFSRMPPSQPYHLDRHSSSLATSALTKRSENGKQNKNSNHNRTDSFNTCLKIYVYGLPPVLSTSVVRNYCTLSWPRWIPISCLLFSF